MQLICFKCCGAERLLRVTFSALQSGGLPCANTQSSQHQLSAGRGARLQRCPWEQAGRVQAGCLLMHYAASNVARASQASHRAAWYWSRAVPVRLRIRVNGSGCAWPGWPPKPTVAGELKGWEVTAMSCLQYHGNSPKISHSGSNCGRNTQSRSLHL